MKRVSIAVFAVFLNMIFLSLPAAAQAKKLETSLAQDILIKSEVETAVSMLQAIFIKYQKGEMSLVQAKKLGADLLRELRYGTEGYFWADTTEGILVAKDTQGTFYIKELLAKGKVGGGYVEYWFPKKEQSSSQPKRSYVFLFKPFKWVVGSGYYR